MPGMRSDRLVPRSRLAQIPGGELRKMYLPHTIPVRKPQAGDQPAPVNNFFMVGMDPKHMLTLMLRAMGRG